MVVISTLALFFFKIFISRVSAQYGGYIAGAANAVTIAILDAVYTRVALTLNHWENYRTKTEFEDKCETFSSFSAIGVSHLIVFLHRRLITFVCSSDFEDILLSM